MTSRSGSFTRYYGAHPLHLLTMVAGFALLGYVLVALTPDALWNPGNWWQSIAVWFAVAVIGHDLVLFPLYALADAVLFRTRRRVHRRLKVPAHNHIRVPALGVGLTLLVFAPGIVQQGADTYSAATGHPQQPFLGRWLLLAAAMFATSAVVYTVRLFWARRRYHQQTIG